MYATTSVFVKCSNAAIARSGIFNMLRNSCFTVKYMKQRKKQLFQPEKIWIFPEKRSIMFKKLKKEALR